MKRLTIDGFCLRFPRSGVVNHAFNTIAELAKEPDLDICVLLEDTGFSDPSIADTVSRTLKARIVEKLPSADDFGWGLSDGRKQRLAARLASPDEISRAVAPGDLYYATDWYHYPVRHALLNVLHYHDLTAKLFPDFHEHTNIVKEARKARVARDFDHIITGSDSTRADVINHLNIPPERVTAAHLGVDSIYEKFAPKSRRSFLKTYGLDPSCRYVLSVSTIEPRKNVAGVLTAFKILREKSEYSDLRLVLTGNMGWRNQELEKFLTTYPYRDQVVFTGYVPLDDMPSLYFHAAVFIYLSHYEGFGIPILEAMKSFCPVVCSDVSSMPEVIGRTGLTVSPREPEAAAVAMARIVDDSSFADSLRFAAYARSKNFTWRNHAAALIRVLGSA